MNFKQFFRIIVTAILFFLLGAIISLLIVTNRYKAALRVIEIREKQIEHLSDLIEKFNKDYDKCIEWNKQAITKTESEKK